MSFVRRVQGDSLRFLRIFFGIIVSYHPKVSMIIIKKQAANRGNPVVDRCETTSTAQPLSDQLRDPQQWPQQPC
jgi:hypothetical protein